MALRIRATSKKTRQRRILALSLVAILMLLLVACSGPGGDDDDPTATVTDISTAEPTAAASSTPTTAPEPTATLEPEPTATVEPTATATAEPEPTATAPPATPTVEASPLGAGGAEFTIEGKAVTQVIAANDEGTILYALTSAGISKSTDGGRSWFASGTLPQGEIVVALNDPDVLYAGERGSCGRGPSDTPLTRSTDGGRTWETFKAGQGIEPYLVEAGQQSTLIGADCGLQVSTDGGQSWSRIEALNGLDFFDAASSGDTLTEQAVALGVTEGGTGQLFPIDMSDPANPVAGEAIVQFYAAGAVDWQGDRIVLATSYRIGITDNGGLTWQWSRSGLEDATYSVDPFVEGIPEEESGKVFNYTIVHIDPQNADRIWIGGTPGAFLSIDRGRSWHRVGDVSEIESVAISPGSERVFVSANGGTRVWTLDGK